MTGELGGVDRLARLAATLAGAWGARARASTSAGQERAILRLFGVHGLDAEGRPLAGQVVDRYVGRDPGRLAGGVTLPFAMAAAEYDLTPQQLALDIASGAVDLALEAELLGDRERRAVAEAEVERLTAAAARRVDANRTARRELLDVLGEPRRPWLGTTLVEPLIGDAVGEALGRIEDGIDLVRVQVPVGRELAAYLAEAGAEVAGRSADLDSANPDEGAAAEDDAPTGSQRGLTRLRRSLDEVAAARGAYAPLACIAPALAAPEQAVVAAFERIDLVEADAVDEIVAGGVDPDRALADHAFAQRLLARAGTTLVVGAGPLVVAPDLAAGLPSDAATRSGRALALQLVAVLLARDNGVPPAQLAVGAMPPWTGDEPQTTLRAAAEVAVRRALLPEHPLVFDEPATTADGAVLWSAVTAGVLPAGPAAGIVLRRPIPESMRPMATWGRAAADVAVALAAAYGERRLHGDAATHAAAIIAAATRTLEALDGSGWRSVLGPGPGVTERIRFGADLVVERTEGVDPLPAGAGAAV